MIDLIKEAEQYLRDNELLGKENRREVILVSRLIKALKKKYLTRLEMYHILALLLERQNSGDYSGDPRHYYKRNNRLIQKFEEETTRLTRTQNET